MATILKLGITRISLGTAIADQFSLIVLFISLVTVGSRLEYLTILYLCPSALGKGDNMVIFVAKAALTTAQAIRDNIANSIETPAFRLATRSGATLTDGNDLGTWRCLHASSIPPS